MIYFDRNLDGKLTISWFCTKSLRISPLCSVDYLWKITQNVYNIFLLRGEGRSLWSPSLRHCTIFRQQFVPISGGGVFPISPWLRPLLNHTFRLILPMPVRLLYQLENTTKLLILYFRILLLSQIILQYSICTDKECLLEIIMLRNSTTANTEYSIPNQ